MTAAPTAAAVLRDLEFAPLKEAVIEATGLAYYIDKDHDLATRVARRLEVVGLGTCRAYLTLLRDGGRGEVELDALIAELTIGETFFFRHREMFDALRDVVLPERIEANRVRRQLRIWSAGCSTGAEAYSLSILLQRDLGLRVGDWDNTILGTDINREFLARARQGVYEEWALRNTPDDLRRECFVREDKCWRLVPAYREGVSFQYHNLVAHAFPSLVNNLTAFDVILCRNVTIYFGAEIIRKLIAQFYECLVPGGWLLVGHAEPNLQLFGAFRTVNAAGAVLYQKRNTDETEPPVPALSVVPSWPLPPLVLPSRADAARPWEPAPLPAMPAPTVAPVRPVITAPPAFVASPLTAIREHADRGHWKEAAALCREALVRDGMNAVLHFYRGLVLEQMGDHDEAFHALRRAIYLERTFILAHYYLGLLAQKRNQFEQAVKSFRNVLALLVRVGADHVFPDGDGITAGELKKLTHRHLELLEET